MSDLQAIADRFEIEALRGEFTDAVTMRDSTASRRCRAQTGSKRLKSASLNQPNRSARRPQSRMNRAIPRQSSPIAVTLEPACHAGGRGFESRRSRVYLQGFPPELPLRRGLSPHTCHTHFEREERQSRGFWACSHRDPACA
jgi:hypothetical protein